MRSVVDKVEDGERERVGTLAVVIGTILLAAAWVGATIGAMGLWGSL